MYLDEFYMNQIIQQLLRDNTGDVKATLVNGTVVKIDKDNE